MAVKKNYIKVVAKNGMEHIIPDSKENRDFQTRYHRHADSKDRPKRVSIIAGTYERDADTNELRFDQTAELDVIYEDVTPQDSKLAAATAENSALQAQIEMLQKQLAQKNAKSPAEDKQSTSSDQLIDPTGTGKPGRPKKNANASQSEAGGDAQ